MVASLLVVASNGPFGPTVDGVLILLLLLAAPFVLAAIAARSLLGADPIPWWLVGILLIGTAAVAFTLWETRRDWHWSGFWGFLRILCVADVAIFPIVLFMESGKRDFFRRSNRLKKSKLLDRKARRSRTEDSDDPPQSHGAFIRDKS